MRVLIADRLHSSALDELASLPVEVEYAPDLTRDGLVERIEHVGILVVRSTEVTAEALARAKQLHLIVRAGAAYDNVDVKTASMRGIYVAYTPGKNASAVAELVFGHLVALDRRIPDAVASLRAGRWERAEFSKAEGLFGKTLGIAGFGSVGREVAARAKAFGMEVVAWSRSLSLAKAREAGVGHAKSLEELASRSHALSLHLPLTERTRGVVSAEVLKALPERAMLVNTARAGLVDHAALDAAIDARGLRVAVDVRPDEPREKTGTIAPLRVPGGGAVLYATPHIAASTDQAQLAIAGETVRIIRAFLLQGEVPHAVNVASGTPAQFQLVLRMVDRVGTLANVLGVLKRHGLNVLHITNELFEGGAASCAKFKLASRPSEACLSEIRMFDEVLQVDAVPLPNFA
jgi:D-3-phosphoglycerate dehydrogenase